MKAFIQKNGQKCGRPTCSCETCNCGSVCTC